MAAHNENELNIASSDDDEKHQEGGDGEGEDGEDGEDTTVPAVKIVYCGVCTMPIEYCEWSGTYDACRSWLEQCHSEVAEQVSKGTDQSSSAVKKVAKKAPAVKKGGKVTLSLLTRNGKKHVTVVDGLTTYEGVQPKEAAKFFANKFSCGANPIKDTEQIEIQGDFLGDKLIELIREKWPQVPADAISISKEGGTKKGRKKVASRGGRGRGKRNTIDIGQ